VGKLLEVERAREACQWVLQGLGVHVIAKLHGTSGAEQSRERGGESGRRVMTSGPEAALAGRERGRRRGGRSARLCEKRERGGRLGSGNGWAGFTCLVFLFSISFSFPISN